MISKRDLIARSNSEISPEIKKQVEEMGKRWERVGVKFDSQTAASNPELEKQAKRLIDFTNLINPKTRRK
jgi:hypothetical protein